jgi:hypothetical protein
MVVGYKKEQVFDKAETIASLLGLEPNAILTSSP